VAGLVAACSSGSGNERAKLLALQDSSLAHLTLTSAGVSEERLPVGATSENDATLTIATGLSAGTAAQSAAVEAAMRLRAAGVNFGSADCTTPDFVSLLGTTTVSRGQQQWPVAVQLLIEGRAGQRGIGRVKPPFVDLVLTIPRDNNGGISGGNQVSPACPPALRSAAGLS